MRTHWFDQNARVLGPPQGHPSLREGWPDRIDPLVALAQTPRIAA
jgi:hypothetical protein